MKYFVIYFEIFGKKMKTTVLSDNEENAKKEVKKAIHLFGTSVITEL